MKNAEYSKELGEALADLLAGPKFPDQEFVSGITFGEVYALASRLRETLAAEQPQAVVCLAAENKAIIAAALLAALAGGPTLLLPYAFSAKALADLQQATGFTVALADTPREFPEGVTVICPQPTGPATLPIGFAAAPRPELLKIFTGGSTGTPQLWSKTAENIFGEGFFLARRYGVSQGDCILATIPPYHIYGLLFSVILPLVASATVVGETPSFPREIVDTARDRKVTILASVPVHYRVLRDKHLALRLAFSSAGMLDREDSEAFSRQNGVGVVEVYGSTETGGIATRNRALGEEYFSPFPTIAWKIVEDRLAVDSPYISPELPVDGDGFFISGDRAEVRETGQFSLKGRADAVTKVGGKRVDLEEVGLLIKKQAGVTDCVVMALPEAGGRGHRIAALIQGDVNIPAIQRMLADSLEPYALPRRLKHVPRIPMTRNGKYDWLAITRLLEK